MKKKYLACFPDVNIRVEGGNNGIVHRELNIVEAGHLRQERDQPVLVDLSHERWTRVGEFCGNVQNILGNNFA